MEILGVPPRSMLVASSRCKLFFDSSFRPRIVASSRGKKRHPGTRDLATKLRCKDRIFLSFLECCFNWEPHKRMTPEEALQHPWITEHTPPATQRATSTTSTTSYQQIHGQTAHKYGQDSSNGANSGAGLRYPIIGPTFRRKFQ